MRILHINSYNVKGGAETVFSITSKNPEHINILGYAPSSSITRQGDIIFSSWENDNYFIGLINYIFSLKNYYTLYNFLIKNDIEIIHLHGFFSSLSPSILYAISKIKRKKKIRIIQTLHEFHLICPNASLYNFTKKHICEKCIGHKLKLSVFWVKCDRRGLFYSFIKGVRSIVSNNILKHKDVVDLFICPSVFLKRKLIEDGIDKSKIVILRNPITQKRNTIHNKKKNIICYFGRFSFEKDIPFLVSAFSKFKNKYRSNYQLLLIGDGEEKDNIEHIISQSAIRNDITLKPFLPNDILFDELKECKYFSLTSSCYENSPMTILEAASLGILPIVPRIGGMKESVESLLKAGKTYTPHNEESWIESIIYLENNYSIELAKLYSSLDSLDKYFNTTNYYNILNKVYNNIVKQ